MMQPGSRPPGGLATGSRTPSGMPSGPRSTTGMGVNSGPHAMPPGSSFGFPSTAPAPMPVPKSNALVFVLIAILLGAIGVLAYLVLTK